MFKSGIYIGKVWHHRFCPRQHKFNYKVLMFCFELDKVETTLQPLKLISYEKFNWLSYYEKHQCQQGNLLSLVQQYISEHNISDSRIFLITQLAHFGYCFNPIRFIIISDNTATKIKAILLAVHNTPWGEIHYYWLDQLTQRDNHYQQTISKEMHVSPFLEMDYLYHFQFQKHHQKLVFELSNVKQGEKHFAAGISLEWQELTQKNLNKCLLHHPFSTQKTIAAIYWQALKLWLKGIKFIPHP